MGYSFFIARRYLRSRQKEGFISIISLIAVLGIVVGVAALTFALAMMNGFEGTVKERIVNTTAHVSVFDVFGEGIADYADVESVLVRQPHILAVAPFIYYKAAISSAEENDGVVVRGIIPEQEKRVTQLGSSIVRGAYRLDRDSVGRRRILLGVTLAERLDVDIRDEVVLFSLRGQDISALSSPKVMKFVVAGLFETGMYEYDANLTYIALADAQNLFFLGDRVTGIQVMTDDWKKANLVAQQLEDVLGPPLFATDWMRMHKNLFSWMQLEKYALFLALCLIVAVAAFNIVSMLIMIVIDKRKDIAILKAMGAPTKGITRIFVIKGTLIGLLGTVVGSIVGLGLCWLQHTFNLIPLPAEIYFIDSLPVDIQVPDVLLICAVSLLVSFLATIYPARRAARLYPVEVFRLE
jgi:lipoprotein-releasing system permease protein